jgi:hypothetical protein
MPEKQQKQPAERWPETVDAMIADCPHCRRETEMDNDIWLRTDNACFYQVCKHCKTGYVAERVLQWSYDQFGFPSFAFGIATWRIDIAGLCKLVTGLVDQRRKGKPSRVPTDDEFRALALTDVE